MQRADATRHPLVLRAGTAISIPACNADALTVAHHLRQRLAQRPTVYPRHRSTFAVTEDLEKLKRLTLDERAAVLASFAADPTPLLELPGMVDVIAPKGQRITWRWVAAVAQLGCPRGHRAGGAFRRLLGNMASESRHLPWGPNEVSWVAVALWSFPGEQPYAAGRVAMGLLSGSHA